jgi:hypothetical protein
MRDCEGRGMLDAVGGGFRVVYLGASATEADDVNPLPTTETKGTTSAGEDRVFTTLTDSVKEKSEVIQIAEATARAVAERADEEGPSVVNQAIRTEKIVADAVTSKSEGVSEHMNTEVGMVNVNEESEVPTKVKATRARIEEGNVDTTEVPAKVKATRARIEEGNVDTMEVPAKVKATRARIEEGNVDTTEATVTTSTPIAHKLDLSFKQVTGNVGRKSVALARGKAAASKPATTSAAEQREEAAGLEAVATFPVDVEEKPVEVNPEDIGHAAIGEAGEESAEPESMSALADNIVDRSLKINSEDASEAATALPSESGANEDASPEHPTEGPFEIADSKALDTPVDSEGFVPEVDDKVVEPTTSAEADKGAEEPEPFVRYYSCVPLCAA